MIILNEYKNSHHYWANFEKSEYHCPKCGEVSVWEETSGGDYYVGGDFICTTCGSFFYLPSDPSPNPGKERILEQLRSGIADLPTTRLGN